MKTKNDKYRIHSTAPDAGGNYWLQVGDCVVARVTSMGVRPTHGYYPKHPYARRVEAWAKRRGIPAPLY